MIEQLLLQPGDERLWDLGSGIAAVVSIATEARGLVPGAAAIVAVEEAGSDTQIRISGGDDGESYLVSASLDTDAGETITRELEVRVVDGKWVMPDGGPAMLSIAEFVDRYGLDETVRMTDGTGDGRIDRTLLVSALTDAQSLAEAHLAERYKLPLAEVPQVIKLAIADIARSRLYPNGAPEGIESAGRMAMKTLEKVQAGKLPLGLTCAPEAASSAAPVLTQTGGRAYPDGLKDYL